jgi:hypothetical protein
LFPLRAAKRFPAVACQIALAALLIAAGAVNASAQRAETSVDVGGIALRYADTLNAGAANVSGHALFDWGRAITEAAGTVSQFTSGGSSGQGSLTGSFLSPTIHGILTEVGGFAGGSAHDDGTRTGEIIANARMHFMRARGELFVGGGVGRASFGGGAQRMLLGEIGASTQFQALDATFTLSPIALDSVKYADTQLSLSWSQRTIDFDALLGVRVGDQVTDLGATAKAWGSVSAVAWLKPYLAAVISGGTYPIDPTQGFPGGRFVSASIRFARGARRGPESSPPVSAPGGDLVPAAPVVEGFSTVKADAANVTLRVKAPRAASVEITGDFTSWSPTPLSPVGDGWWSVTFSMRPGKYQMNLRVNRGNWLVPPGLIPLADEFGGSVGLLIVE